MANSIQRIWTSQGPTGKRVKHVAWGYTLMIDGLATPVPPMVPAVGQTPSTAGELAHRMAHSPVSGGRCEVSSRNGGVAKWLRRRSAKPLSGGSNPPAASSLL